MNLVILSGNLGKDPELITNGLKLSLATTDFNGEEKFTLWTDVLLYGKRAENLLKFLVKGKSILVRGSLRSNIDLEGKDRKSVIFANDIELL